MDLKAELKKIVKTIISDYKEHVVKLSEKKQRITREIIAKSEEQKINSLRNDLHSE